MKNIFCRIGLHGYNLVGVDEKENYLPGDTGDDVSYKRRTTAEKYKCKHCGRTKVSKSEKIIKTTYSYK